LQMVKEKSLYLYQLIDPLPVEFQAFKPFFEQYLVEGLIRQLVCG